MQTVWKCSNCGNTVAEPTPPAQCPVCREKCEFLDVTNYTPDAQGGAPDGRIGKK